MYVEYTTVYQITRRIPDWPFACVGLIPFTGGAVIIWGKRRFKWTKPHWLLPAFFCFFGILWSATAGISTLSADWKEFAAYQKGDYQTVEGVVYDFHPMPYEGHQDECFSVQDQQFCYSDYEIAPGFNNATSHGGPIRSGLPVRIAYRDGRILRLDIPDNQVLTSAQSQATKVAGEQQWQNRSSNDPLSQRMEVAALFTAVCWTLWWNVQWKQVMRFWIKPPYQPWVQILFRAFFAANFIGAAVELARQLLSHPIAKQDIAATVQVAGTMCLVVGIMSASVLWSAHRRDLRVESSERQDAGIFAGYDVRPDFLTLLTAHAKFQDFLNPSQRAV